MRKKKVLRLFAMAILVLIVIGGSVGIAFYQGQLWEHNKAYSEGYDQGHSDGKDEVWGEIIDASHQFDPTAWNTFHEAWRLLKENYIDELPPDQELVWAAIQGIVDSLGDPFTEFISAEKRDGYWKDYTFSWPTSDLGSIGVIIDPDEGGLIKSFGEGSPAEEAGLRQGDLIVAVAYRPGEWYDIRESTLDEQMALVIGGLPGAAIWLKVERSGESEPLIFEVVPRVFKDVEVAPAYGFLLTPEVGYLRICSFGGFKEESLQIYSWFRRFLEAVLSWDVEVLVLDLRNNPGGMNLGLLLVADELFQEGEIIVTNHYSANSGFGSVTGVAQRGRLPVEEDHLTTGGLAPEIPLVVLVDERTISAAEVLAAAVQDHGRGILVGETTIGKGTSFRWFELSDGSGLYIKHAYWKTPSGRNIDGVGIEPDIVVSMPEEPNGTDPQLEKALECALILLEGGECR